MSRDWKAQEKQIAKETGGSRNAGSGAFSRKGDVRAGEFLIEAKWTSKRSISLKAEVLEKIVSEALREGRTPVVQVELNGRAYGIVEWDDLLALLWNKPKQRYSGA